MITCIKYSSRRVHRVIYVDVDSRTRFGCAMGATRPFIFFFDASTRSLSNFCLGVSGFFVRGDDLGLSTVYRTGRAPSPPEAFSFRTSPHSSCRGTVSVIHSSSSTYTSVPTPPCVFSPPPSDATRSTRKTPPPPSRAPTTRIAASAVSSFASSSPVDFETTRSPPVRSHRSVSPASVASPRPGVARARRRLEGWRRRPRPRPSVSLERRPACAPSIDV